MAQFRKKPVVIEAVQWDGDQKTFDAIERWVGEPVNDLDGYTPLIPTLEGDMLASLNDWIIKGVKGEIYPCKPDIFPPPPKGNPMTTQTDALELAGRLEAAFDRFLERYAAHDGRVSVDDLADYLRDARDEAAQALRAAEARIAALESERDEAKSGRAKALDLLDASVKQTSTANAALTVARAEIAVLREDVKRVQSDREYITGFNAGWDEAINMNLAPFPTMLRKLWSGHEVQQWIDSQFASARALAQGEAATEKGGG